jgi:hypothetical protein
MQIWDPDLPMPFDDLFEVQAPPSEVLVVQTQSRGQLVLNNLTSTQTLGGRPAPDHPKAPFIPQIIPINIHTREFPKLDYNIVEDLKILKENISVMDICRIPQQKGLLVTSIEISRKSYNKR